MTTFTALGFPRPEATDPIALGYDAIADLADAVDTFLSPRLADSGWVTAGFVAAANWSNTNCRARKIGATVHVHIEITRTTSIKSAPASGDAGNEVMVTVPAAFRPGFEVALNFVAASRTNGGGRLGTDGLASLYSMNSDSTIQIGDVLVADLVFMV